MRRIIEEYRNELLKLPLSSKNEARIRETAQLLITSIRLDLKENSSKVNPVINDCLRYLKTLRMITLKEAEEAELFNCRLDLFLSEICAAADLILSLKNKRVEFFAHPVLSTLCPPLFRDAVLILVSEAAKCGKRVFVTLRETRSQILTIIETSKGSIDCDSENLYTVNHIMKLHGGNLFLTHSETSFKMILSLPVTSKKYDEYPLPDFAEYVCDKISPVRIMLE